MADPKQEPGPGGRATPSWTIKPVGPEEASIGATMREVRESRGLSIEDVAAVLKIRRDNLAAIEESRVDDLPGLPYAIGFVRTYADYLDMDGAAAVEKFKAETADTEEETELAFPMPIRERRFPGALVVGGSLVLAAAVYGAWFFLSNGAEPTMDTSTEPEVPVAAESVTGAADEPPAQAEEAPPAEETGKEEAAASAPPPEGEGRDETPDETPAAEPAEPPPATAPVREESAAPEPATPAEEPAAGAEPAAPTPAEEPAAPTAAPTAAEGAAEAVSQEATAPTAPTAAPGPSRVEIRATADSWVQIRDADDKIVFARVLRQGESYRVPGLPGLAMVTGNAGALSVLVDGKPIEPLGPLGAVRRNIVLDADSLLAGQ